MLGHIVQAAVDARPAKRLLGHFQNALAIPLGIRARLSPAKL
jgi:hypothetical protein